MDEGKYAVSEAAVCAAALNHFNGVCFGGNETEKAIFRKALAMSLGALVPVSAKGVKDMAMSFFIFHLAKGAGLMEIEAQVLTILKPAVVDVDPCIFSDMLRLEYSAFVGEELLEIVAKGAIKYLYTAGVTDIKAAFDEVDDLRFAVED